MYALSGLGSLRGQKNCCCWLSPHGKNPSIDVFYILRMETLFCGPPACMLIFCCVRLRCSCGVQVKVLPLTSEADCSSAQYLYLLYNPYGILRMSIQVGAGVQNQARQSNPSVDCREDAEPLCADKRSWRTPTTTAMTPHKRH